jgi:hypothetical protein
MKIMNEPCNIFKNICLRFSKCNWSCINVNYLFENNFNSLSIKEESELLHIYCAFLWDKCLSCNKFAVECNILLINSGKECEKNCLYCDYFFTCKIHKYKNKDKMPGYLQRIKIHKEYELKSW